MGLDVSLEDEAGRVLGAVGDPLNILHRVLPGPDASEYCYLGLIDWYGNTVINRVQAARFLSEWKQLEMTAIDAAAVGLLVAIRQLAERLDETPHLYLWFRGD